MTLDIRRAFGAACVAASLSLTSVALAQYPLHSIYGDDEDDSLGWSVAGIGDVNSDGWEDALVGSPNDEITGFGSGTAYAVSGQDGSVLYAIHGANSAWLGISCAGVGDVDGDAVPDLAIGSPNDSAQLFWAGSVRVYSGVDATELYAVHGYDTSMRLGTSTAGAGDVNGDGWPDVVVGSRWADTNGADSGLVLILSGPTGEVLHTISGTEVGGEFGRRVDGAGDVNADGYDDVIVGAHGEADHRGRFYVLSGVDASVLYSYTGSTPWVLLGKAVAGLGDLDGDGHAEFAASVADLARVYDGQTGSLLYELHHPAGGNFGDNLAGGGDLDGDGSPDLLVTGIETYPTPGGVFGFSGLDGSLLFHVTTATPGDLFGEFVDFLGEAATGGIDGFVVGARNSFENAPYAGAAHVYSLRCAYERYCEGAPNSAGAGALASLFGSSSVEANDARLELTGAPPDEVALFYYGADAVQVPFGDGYRCIDGSLTRLGTFHTGPSGSASYVLDLTNLPTGAQIQAGDRWHFQCYYRDGQGPGGSGFNLSDALTVWFCP